MIGITAVEKNWHALGSHTLIICKLEINRCLELNFTS